MQTQMRVSRLFCMLCISIGMQTVSPTNAENLVSGAAARIEANVRQIEVETDPILRREDAKRLPALLLHTEKSELANLSSRIIDRMASLLSDNDDVVRSDVAGALGLIGPPAKRALPALEVALKSITSSTLVTIGPSLSSEASIRWAIKAITGDATLQSK
jgi:hypothetical protein